jgi:pyruvate/2-oxoglutarate dehydrogenase complex dihydrolipoamide acyltransferase (E2) component
MAGYSPTERQKVIEDTAEKLYAVICEGANGDSFREKVLAKTTENLNDILTSKDAQVEIKGLIFKGIKIALEDPDYMKPLLFKSMLNMGGISSIMQNLFKEALSTSQSSNNKGLNDFLVEVKGILDNPPNPDKGGSAQNVKQTGGAELLAEGLAEGAAESAASAGAAAAESAAETAATTAAEGAAASAATAAESAGASAVATAEKEGAELAAKGEGELAKGALKGKDGKPLTPEEQKAAEAEAEKKTQEENMKKGMDFAAAMKNATPLTSSSSGFSGEGLADSATLTSNEYLNDLLKGMDLRSTETQRNILNSVNKALSTHLHNSKQEITKSITTIVQNCAQDLSSKMNDQVYTIYVYGALSNNFNLLENAIHKWDNISEDPNDKSIAKELSTISQDQNVGAIIDFMIQAMGNAESEKQKEATLRGGNITHRKTTTKNKPPAIRRTKHHPFFARKLNISMKAKALNKNNKKFTRKHL